MQRNVGGTEQGLRVAAGIGLLAHGAFGPIGRWGLVGIVPLATRLMGSCPAYSLLDVNTCAASTPGA
jgi:hypothetical protein